jgi:hypothetical protein
MATPSAMGTYAVIRGRRPPPTSSRKDEGKSQGCAPLEGRAGRRTLAGMTTCTHIRSIVLALISACLGLGLYAGAAHAEFEPPFDVTVMGESGMPKAEVDPTGATHFLWYRTGAGIQTRTRMPDGALGSVRTLTPVGADHDLAVDGGGNVHFVWTGPNGAKTSVWTRGITPDGNDQPAAVVSTAGFDAHEPQVVGGPAGAVFVWTGNTNSGLHVQARRMAPNGTLGPIVNISAPGSVAQPQVALDDAGNAVFIWARGFSIGSFAEARRWDADGTLGEIKNVATAGGYVYEPRVAFDSNGTALFATMRSGALQLRRMAPDGSLSAIQDLRMRATDTAFEPEIAVDDDGAAEIVWQAYSAEEGYTIQTRHRFANGNLGPVEILGTWDNGLSPMPNVAFDEHGNAHHVWLTTKDKTMVVMSRTRTSYGSLGALQQLSADLVEANHPTISSGPSGRPIATWIRSQDDSTRLVQGAVMIPPPPAGGGGTGTTSTTGTGPAPDLVAPRLSGLALSPAKLRVGRRGTVKYTLSEVARVTVKIARRRAGRLVVKGTLVERGQAGRERLSLPARLRGRRLKPGRYVLLAAATDAAGNRSQRRSLAFKVVRPSN